MSRPERQEKPRYAGKVAVRRAFKMAADNGLEVGGFELGVDGSVRILSRSASESLASDYDRWKAGQPKEG